jgi:hypothetical protein
MLSLQIASHSTQIQGTTQVYETTYRRYALHGEVIAMKDMRSLVAAILVFGGIVAIGTLVTTLFH